MIEKIKCLNLYSYKVEEMVNFYHKVLNLPILFEGFDDKYDGVQIGLGDNQFKICIWDRNVWSEYEGVGPVSIAMQGNINEIYNVVLENGYKIDKPVKKDWGLELEVLDPDGNHLYIMS
jgi:predicted enzyme related to lactoylglutathione lyase